MNTSTKNLLIVGLTISSIVFVFSYVLPNIFGYEVERKTYSELQIECNFPVNGNDTQYMNYLMDLGLNRTSIQQNQLDCYLDTLSKPDGLLYTFTPNADSIPVY